MPVGKLIQQANMTMILRYSPTSPYVRKVSVVISELGLSEQIERIATDPWIPETDLAAQNPLGKVPTLITRSGQVLFDSHVICEYLDGLHCGPRLFPSEPKARIQALQLEALGDGVLDAAVLAFIEAQRRPEAHRWAVWASRQRAAIDRSLAWLTEHMDLLGGQLHVGHLTVGCALGYLDFRLADLNWPERYPGLADWYVEFSGRESMRETIPSD